MKNIFILFILCIISSCNGDDACTTEHQAEADAFLGRWDILHTYKSEENGAILRQDTFMHKADFNENGTGFYHRENFSQDMLYSHYRSANTIALHLFSGDALLHTNHNSTVYDILELNDNKIILQDGYNYQYLVDDSLIVDRRYMERLEMNKIK